MRQILNWYVRIFILLLPLFFWPLSTDAFGLGKNLWLMGGAAIGWLLWLIDLLVAKREKMEVSKAFWVMLGLMVWAGIWWWREQIGVRARSAGLPLGWGTWAAMAAWLFLLIQTGNKEERKIQLNMLTISGIIAGLSALVVFLIPTAKLPLLIPNSNNPLLAIGQNWSITGSMLAEMVLLAFLALEWGKRLVEKYRLGWREYMVSAITSAFLVLALLLDLYRTTKLGLGMMDWSVAWAIAVEVFKRNPLQGIGVGNFSEAFTLYRPVSYNLTKFWSTAFSGSSVGILQIWTEMGIAAVIWATFLVTTLWRKRRGGGFEWWRVLLVLVLVWLLPLNIISLFLLMWVLAGELFNRSSLGLKLVVGEGGDSRFNVLPWLVAIVMVAIAVAGGYETVRVALGEKYMRESLVAASKNDGSGTYSLQIKAVGMNPEMAEYRRMYSQTNMALVKAILAKGELTADDKEKAPVLMQQAVREAKAAISLEPMNSIYWQNLAAIYRDMAGSLEGAADWSLQSYQQAVALDPVNPLIKLDMGGLLYAANNFESADRVFEEAVVNKQDFANAWYNWAYSAKKMNRIDVAVSRMTQAVALVPATSGDYENASKELAAWNKELEEAIAKAKAAQEAAQPKQPETLKTAQPLPTGTQNVELPKAGNEPPAAVTTPSPSPTVVPTGAPTVAPTP